MADKTATEQKNIAEHIRNTVFASEVAGLSEDEDFISVGADIYGVIEIGTNKSGLDLINKWNTHRSSCTDGCGNWSI